MFYLLQPVDYCSLIRMANLFSAFSEHACLLKLCNVKLGAVFYKTSVLVMHKHCPLQD